jgi:hypothetical protein
VCLIDLDHFVGTPFAVMIVYIFRTELRSRYTSFCPFCLSLRSDSICSTQQLHLLRSNSIYTAQQLHLLCAGTHLLCAATPFAVRSNSIFFAQQLHLLCAATPFALSSISICSAQQLQPCFFSNCLDPEI